MYKKIPEFQTLRTRLYAVFTGKIIQREPCAGGTRPRGFAASHAIPKRSTAERHANPTPRSADNPRRHTPGTPTDAACAAVSGCATPPRATPQPPSGRRRFPFPGSTSTAFPANAESELQAGCQHRRSVHPPPKKKGVPGPRNADISPNTPPEANRAPKAGPPRGCAPWRRGARGQGSSR